MLEARLGQFRKSFPAPIPYEGLELPGAFRSQQPLQVNLAKSWSWSDRLLSEATSTGRISSQRIHKVPDQSLIILLVPLALTRYPTDLAG